MVASNDPAGFRYPPQPLVRRHGPAGYASYRSYRPWLREYRRWRRTWIRILELAADNDPALFQQLLGYPEDLPDLRACRAPENLRPEGIAESCFERRERGELPETYLF